MGNNKLANDTEPQFYLRDSRNNVGSSAIFWSSTGGYTTDVSIAEKFAREKAIAQYQSRETDIPLRCDLVDGKTYLAVDMQNLPGDGVSETNNYLVVKSYYDGNNVLFYSTKNRSHSLESVECLTKVEALRLMKNNDSLVCYPADAIREIARPVISTEEIDTKRFLKLAKIDYIKPIKSRGMIYKCYNSCGRFLTANQYYTGCPNCK